MRPGYTDVTFQTRVHDLAAGWTFVMAKLDGGEMLTVEMVAQDWRADDHDEWQDTFLVTVQVRLKETE